MALVVTNRGSGNHNSSATSFTLSPASNLAAGSMAVLCVAADNSVNGGATNDVHNFTTVTDSIGNTWTKRRSPVFDNGATSAGVQGAIWTTQQNISALQTGTVITVSFGDATTAKTWTLTEIVPTAGNTVEYRTGGDKSAGATGTVLAMGASASVTSGEVILAAFFLESGTTQSVTTPDGDTTNGSWTTNQYNEIGTTVAGSGIISQAKIVTGTATQSYDVTVGISSDYHGSYIIVTDTLAARSASVSFTQAADTSVVTSTAAVAATVAATQAADTNVITATVPASASVSVTQAADTNVITATVPALASVSVTQAADTNVITVTVADAGSNASVSLTQANDTAAVTATAAIAAASSHTQASDTNAIAATVPALASASITQAADTATLTATVPALAVVSFSQAADTAAVTATVPALGAVAFTQGADTLSISATSLVTSEAAVSFTQASDAATLTATALVSASASLTQASDSVSTSGTVPILAALAFPQASDVNTFTATVVAPGQLTATGLSRRRNINRGGSIDTTFRPGRSRR